MRRMGASELFERSHSRRLLLVTEPQKRRMHRTAVYEALEHSDGPTSSLLAELWEHRMHRMAVSEAFEDFHGRGPSSLAEQPGQTVPSACGLAQNHSEPAQ